MIRQEDPLQEAPFKGKEVTQEAEEDFPMEEEDHQEEDHQEEDHQEETTTTTTTEDEDQTSWWETLQRYSKEYERKLSLSLLFGGSMQVLTAKTLPSPTHTKEVSYSSRTFKGTMWPNGSSLSQITLAR